MHHELLPIETPDGSCPTHVYHPDGDGPWPGVIVYMDAIGMRPAMMEIAERIARAGYYVLLPDVFYRVSFDPTRWGVNIFRDPKGRAELMNRVMPSASPANVMRDTQALLTHLAGEPRVSRDGIGVTGYCMGGRLSLYAAGTFGARVAAAASYHAGRLATDAPDSPHRLAPLIRARVYVAGAIRDAGFDDEQKERLDRALTDAGVDHTIETYNARHGFVPSDTVEHDAAAEAKHWETLLDLFHRTLQAS